MGVVVLLVVLFLTGALTDMPKAVLGAIVFLIGIDLIDIAGLRRVYAARRSEFVIAALTGIVVFAIGVEQGIVLAIIASVIDHLRRSYRPSNTTVEVSNDRMKSAPVHPTSRAVPGLVIYRFNASLYYANANLLLEQTTSLMASTEPDHVRWLCIDAAGVSDLDYSAGETLRQVHEGAQEHDVRVVFAEVQPHVRAELEVFDLVALFGEQAFFETVADVLDAYRAEPAIP
jgi:MFS superfamily sulfate permease-like transporter